MTTLTERAPSVKVSLARVRQASFSQDRPLHARGPQWAPGYPRGPLPFVLVEGKRPYTYCVIADALRACQGARAPGVAEGTGECLKREPGRIPFATAGIVTPRNCINRRNRWKESFDDPLQLVLDQGRDLVYG